MKKIRLVDRKLKIAVFFSLIALVLMGCGDKPSDANGESGNDNIKLTFATTMDDSGIDKDIKEFFDKKLTDLSDGSMEVEFFMGGQLGGEREALEQMKLGELDMGYNVLQAEMYYPEYNAISIPYLFPDFDSMRKFMEGPIGEKIDKVAREKGGVVPLGMHGYGARWTTSNEPFTNLEELKGLKIRMPEIEWWVDVWDELGALPTPIAATEIVTALKTGTVDAQENFLTNIAGRKMWDYQDYLMKTEHIEFYQTWLVSEKTWEDKLSKNQQKVLQEVVDETVAYVDEIVDKSNKEFVKEIQENGMELIEVDQNQLREAAQPAVKEIIENDLDPGVYEEVEKAIGE